MYVGIQSHGRLHAAVLAQSVADSRATGPQRDVLVRKEVVQIPEYLEIKARCAKR